MKRVAVLLLVLTLPIWAGTITKTFTLTNDNIHFSQYNQYTIVEIDGASNFINPGEPVLPRFIHHFVIPASAKVTNVEVLEQDVEFIAGEYTLLPGQKPRAFSLLEEIEFVSPNPAIYNSTSLYPAVIYESYGVGKKTGFRLFDLALFPLRYVPAEGKLRLAKTMTVQISYEEGVYSVQTITQRQYDVATRAVKALVSNPEDISRFTPRLRSDAIDDINYAIVIGGSFQTEFQPMKEWKTKKGYNADIFTVSWITSNYTGYDGTDTQAKIKDFFADYFANKGLIWGVLAGDVQTVLDRECYTTFYSPYYLACDWYFADIDDWDRDNDGLYGEPGAQAPDAYCDIYVGRIPVDNTTEVTNYWTKLETFEKNPPTAGIKKVVLPSGWLWQSLNYHGRYCNNMIHNIMAAHGFTSGKLEEQPAPATRNWINNNEPQFGHPCGHGNTAGVYNQYSNMITNSDVPSLTNDLGFIMNSIACHPGDFDDVDDCFAERLITNNTYSAVDAIFNNEYGWGQPPQLGPSESIDTTFYHVIADDTLWVGIAHAVSKEHWRAWIWGSNNVWHFCGLELNLFGDPEVHGYLEVPIPLTASHSSSIPQGSQSFPVTVTDGTKAPVPDALVCCYKDGEVHETGRTNASGQVTLTINPQSVGTMYVTATAFNYTPYEGSTNIIGILEEKSSQAGRGVWINSSVVKNRIAIHYEVAIRNNLDVNLYDVTGAQVGDVYHGHIEGKGTISWNVKDLAAGIYFVKIECDNTIETNRIIIVK